MTSSPGTCFVKFSNGSPRGLSRTRGVRSIGSFIPDNLNADPSILESQLDFDPKLYSELSPSLCLRLSPYLTKAGKYPPTSNFSPFLSLCHALLLHLRTSNGFPLFLYPHSDRRQILRELCPFDLSPDLLPDYPILSFLQVQAIFLVPKLPDHL